MTNAVKASGNQAKAGQYQKRVGAKATVGEAMSLANQIAYPAILAARWAVALSATACVIALVALWVAIR